MQKQRLEIIYAVTAPPETAKPQPLELRTEVREKLAQVIPSLQSGQSFILTTMASAEAIAACVKKEFRGYSFISREITNAQEPGVTSVRFWRK